MIVKNIKTNNKNLIIDLIIKELCENNISYVYIKDSSELHFNDYIFRFYENFFIYSRIEAPIWKAKEVQEKQKNDSNKNLFLIFKFKYIFFNLNFISTFCTHRFKISINPHTF